MPIQYIILDHYIIMIVAHVLQENHTSTATTRTCDADAPDGRCIFLKIYFILFEFMFLSALPTVSLVVHVENTKILVVNWF